MARARVKTVDKGYNSLLRRARKVSGKGQLSVGVHPREGGMRYRSGVTVAEVARLHETGTDHMVARPFVSYWWVKENGQRRVRDATRKILEMSLARGLDPLAELERAGKRYVAQVRSTFDLMRPLRLSTIRRKRSDRKLYESGLLWRSVGYRAKVGNRTKG